MKTFEINTKVKDDGSITIKGLPLDSGKNVHVIIHYEKEKAKNYPLKGTPFELVEPFISVAQDDWTVLKK